MTFETAPKNTEEKTMRITSHQNIGLDGTEFLTMDKVITTWRIVRELDSKGRPFRIISKEIVNTETTKLSFPLKEVTIGELYIARCGKIPGFVLKEGERYFYTKIPAKLNFVSLSIGEHKCGKECLHLSALSDEEGGCEKVRDIRNKMIEKYPFIVRGYETFNTKHDSFRVLECKNYQKCSSRRGI